METIGMNLWQIEIIVNSSPSQMIYFFTYFFKLKKNLREFEHEAYCLYKNTLIDSDISMEIIIFNM